MRVFLLESGLWEADSKGFKISLGLAYLGSYLKKLGHEVTALDLNYPAHNVSQRYMWEDPAVISSIQSFRPDIVGISCCTETRHNARYWAGVIKQRMPDVKIVVGGPHVSFVPDQTLNHWKAVDYVIRFEGEKPLAELIDALVSGKPLTNVPSLAYRDESGRVIVNQRAGLIENLDSIPFPDMAIFCDGDEIILNSVPIEARYDLFQGPMVHVMTSRGCPFRCRFCSASHFWDARVRFRSPGNVIEELKLIRKRWPIIKTWHFMMMGLRCAEVTSNRSAN